MTAHNSKILFLEIYEINDAQYQNSGTQHLISFEIGERYVNL